MNLELMWLLDEQYTKRPYRGIRRMTAALSAAGHRVNQKRVARLLRLMGLEALYPKKRLSVAEPGHKISPYLLRGFRAERRNQVCGSDITFIRLRQSLVYLVAIMDWFSRFVLAWRISVTMETSFCVSALNWALRRGLPEIGFRY
jgi:putative transposase